eukprot:scaffold133876_cov41-Tisochrysis_lutea.AAC.1
MALHIAHISALSASAWMHVPQWLTKDAAYAQGRGLLSGDCSATCTEGATEYYLKLDSSGWDSGGNGAQGVCLRQQIPDSTVIMGSGDGFIEYSRNAYPNSGNGNVWTMELIGQPPGPGETLYCYFIAASSKNGLTCIETDPEPGCQS